MTCSCEWEFWKNASDRMERRYRSGGGPVLYSGSHGILALDTDLLESRDFGEVPEMPEIVRYPTRPGGQREVPRRSSKYSGIEAAIGGRWAKAALLVLLNIRSSVGGRWDQAFVSRRPPKTCGNVESDSGQERLTWLLLALRFASHFSVAAPITRFGFANTEAPYCRRRSTSVVTSRAGGVLLSSTITAAFRIPELKMSGRTPR